MATHKKILSNLSTFVNGIKGQTYGFRSLASFNGQAFDDDKRIVFAHISMGETDKNWYFFALPPRELSGISARTEHINISQRRKRMKNIKRMAVLFFLSISGVLLINQVGYAATNDLSAVLEVQKYYRSLHILIMALVGFGFLMNFIKTYGRSAATATYLLVSIGIPLYMFINGFGIFGEAHTLEIDKFIFSEFATVSLLICAGAVLGRLKMPQYLLLGLLFIPAYMVNEWIVLGGGLGLIPQGSFVDTGGSIVIHAFGAFFGLGVLFTMTTKKEFDHAMPEDNVSEIFALLGSMVLWVFWPSFCAALVPEAQIPMVVLNVVMALCGATLSTYIATVLLRHKISVIDIANATLAGGVAIGSVCDRATNQTALIIGIVAGILSVVGFAVIQPKLEEVLQKKDTCGVMYLHGLPGLFGGLSAMFVVSGMNVMAQIIGIFVSLAISLIAGFVSGKILAISGRRIEPYIDEEELIEADS